MKHKNSKKDEEEKVTIEELLHELRTKNNLSYLELSEKINDRSITEKTVKKWEKGLEYPNLNIIYQLSEIYNIPSEDFLKAKDNSFKSGLAGINFQAVKWICYFLDISIKAGTIITILIVVLLLIGSFWFFITMCYNVDKNRI